MKNENFNLRRIGLLIRRQTRMNFNPLLISAGGLTAFLLIILVLSGYQSNINITAYYGITLPFLLGGGYIFTSVIFSELQHYEKSIFYLTLPASPLEKLASAWLISSPVFVILVFIALIIMNYLVSLILSFLPGTGMDLFNPFNRELFLTLGVYMVTQTVFILGAVYFKKHNFFKTILALFLTGLAIAIYAVIVARITFGGFHSLDTNFHQLPENFDHFITHTFPMIIKILFWGVLVEVDCR